MDSSKGDDRVVRASYPDARYIESHYGISAYPTLLFFAPDGRILDKTTGSRDADGMLSLAGIETDPKNNYYRLVEEYQNGKKMDMTEFRQLAWNGMRLGDTAQSQKLASNYIRSLTDAERYKKENIEFMSDFTKNSKDPAFAFFYRNADSIDKIENNDVYAQQLIQSIIYKEMVLPFLARIKNSVGEQVVWQKLADEIRNKYNQFYAERVVIGTKMSWAAKRKNYKEYSSYLVEYELKYGQKTGDNYDFILNNWAWSVFTNTDDSSQLNIALSWSGQAVLLNPGSNWIDTYANILYKLHRTQQALLWEEMAVKLAPGAKEFEETYKKMKSGQPTWPQN